MQLLVFETIVFLAVIFCDLLVAELSLKRHSESGISLGLTCLGAVVVTASYLASVFVEDYFAYSVLSSIYFIGIDLTLLALSRFVRRFVMGAETHRMGIGWVILLIWSAVDILLLIINPFREVSIHYVHVNALLSHYVYQMRIPYRLHLLLAYVMIAVILFYLVRKAIRVPSVYRRQYEYAILVLFLVVLINAFYLYIPISDSIPHLDYSLLAYSLAACLFYWIRFLYTEHGMMDLLRNHIISTLDSGILLFDYENKLILKNEKADELLAGFPWGKKPELENMAKLSADNNASDLLTRSSDGKKYSFQCYPEGDVHMLPMTCDYSALLSRKNEVLGRLFIFSELTLEYDSLTGFYAWDVYKGREGNAPAEFVTAVAFDLNGLAVLNSQEGRSSGDRAIQLLARLMRKHFPRGTVFIRGREAILVAVCTDVREEDVNQYVERIQESLQQDGKDLGTGSLAFQSGARTSIFGEKYSDVVRSAMETLRMKKLLDQSSRHSEVLYSLVQMLQECDKDTEKHVRRTQKLGLTLGKRIGLTEEQQSNLALLAILHDIGKIGIPLDILNKPGKLSEAEWNVLTTHVEKGYQIANSSTELKGIADMILYHHERWDGKGYPDGLSKESIPLLSRMISVVDAYDAMVNDRPYRKGMPPEKACQELRRCAGTQFDPSLVSEFLQMLMEQGVIDALPEDTQRSDKDEPEAKEKETSLQWSLEIQQSEKRMVPRVHTMRHARYIVDRAQNIVWIDEAFTQLTGYTQQDVETGNLRQQDLIFEEDRNEYERLAFREMEKNSAAYLEHWIRRKDGSAIFVFCFGRKFYDSAIREERGEIIMSDSASSYSVQSVVNKEHSKAFRRLERWENKFRRDSLTGLLNHEAFKNDVETRILSGDAQLLLLMMDVDRFKEYNDTYGHRAGDEFLIIVAQTLMSAIRNDDFACRMGGDEFAIALFFQEDTQWKTMLQRAEQICDKINLTLTSFGDGGTSLSMGGAFLDENHHTFDSLYEAADHALYASKESGRAKVSFWENQQIPNLG